MEDHHLLELAGVTKSFRLPTGDRLDILRGLDLTVDAGVVTAIVGRSGSGKSTLLNLLGLLDTPTSGAFRCDGADVARMRDAKRSRLRGEFLGFIFQQFHLLDRRTALENVAEPLLFGTRRDLGQRMARAAALLGQVGLAERAHSMPHLLSGGEQQRVAIARALVRKPRVVLADEPTGALDEATGERILDLLFALVRAEGLALILVTHDRAVASRADRILTLAEGRLHAGVLEVVT
ncbi:MAG: ABC transporter ATP-binding protein [Thermomicrobiales bacterium]